MAIGRTREQIKSDYIECMGEELGLVFNFLDQDLIWLYTKFHEFVNLFGKGKERVDTLNYSASFFFYMIQKSLWEDILLNIGRITDRQTTSGRKNVTIQRLPSLIGHNEFKGQIKDLVDEVLDLSQFSRDRRNRSIAHNDFELAINQRAKPIESTSLLQVRNFLNRCAELLNLISYHYLNSTTVYDFDNPPGAVESLLYYLNLGKRLEEEREKRMRNGAATNEDFE